jgi:hypothetical protein
MITELPIHGQGVFLFQKIQDISSCIFQLYTSDRTNGLIVEFTHNSVWVKEMSSLKPLIDASNNTGFSCHKDAYYWCSIDSQNYCLCAGIGEPRLETSIYYYKYIPADETIRKSIKSFLESLRYIEYPESIKIIRILKDPITSSIPLIVKDTHELSMDDIAKGKFMPKANLSPICQKLYDCISGKNFTLNTPDFPDFTQAIEYSIRTPGLWCYNKIRDKSREFNPDIPDISETYLRITLGQNNGESPGIPYVMEIWPVGHYSPIHSHANASAIIRVLNGEINVSLYPFLCAEKDGVKPFGNVTFKQDDVAWITPTLNQIHQLKNLLTNSYTCITIQCYMYTEKDFRHYDYFDYLDADGKKQTYQPDSDMDFIDFKNKIREEW